MRYRKEILDDEYVLCSHEIGIKFPFKFNLDNIILKIVPGKGFNQLEADVVVGELKKRLGSQVKIEAKVVKEIPRSTAGKFRAVISHVNNTL